MILKQYKVKTRKKIQIKFSKRISKDTTTANAKHTYLKSLLILGMRVEPPTSTTSSMSEGFIPKSCMRRSIGNRLLSNKELHPVYIIVIIIILKIDIDVGIIGY